MLDTNPAADDYKLSRLMCPACKSSKCKCERHNVMSSQHFTCWLISNSSYDVVLCLKKLYQNSMSECALSVRHQLVYTCIESHASHHSSLPGPHFPYSGDDISVHNTWVGGAAVRLLLLLLLIDATTTACTASNNPSLPLPERAERDNDEDLFSIHTSDYMNSY